MFVCIGANPALDKRLRLTTLTPGSVNRAMEAQVAPGGKATHVAMVLKTLGNDPEWIGFAGGAAGEELLNGLGTLGIRAHAIRTEQPTRVNLEIIDGAGAVTEILEPGGRPSDSEIASLESACEEAFARGKGEAVVVASGSLAPGMRKSFYADLIRRAHVYGCSFFLDTSGEALRAALEAGPDFVKPNRDEAEWIIGRKIGDSVSALDAARKFITAGVKSAAVSLGELGLVWCSEMSRAYFASTNAIRARSTVGCGDSVMAAFAHASGANLAGEDTVRLAVACGGANCLADSPGAARREDIASIQKEVCVRILA